MTVTAVHKDADALTMAIEAQFDATVEQVWDLWADPRKLERWWGPPEYPATFVDHELRAGGKASYFMTGPEGDTPAGWWSILSAEPPHSIEILDGFADESGTPNPDMPAMTFRVAIAALDTGGTSMTITTQFPTLEAMEQIVAMGVEEGMTSAMGQIDAILAEA